MGDCRVPAVLIKGRKKARRKVTKLGGKRGRRLDTEGDKFEAEKHEKKQEGGDRDVDQNGRWSKERIGDRKVVRCSR